LYYHLNDENDAADSQEAIKIDVQRSREDTVFEVPSIVKDIESLKIKRFLINYLASQNHSEQNWGASIVNSQDPPA
jgi:hypothetical protein